MSIDVKFIYIVKGDHRNQTLKSFEVQKVVNRPLYVEGMAVRVQEDHYNILPMAFSLKDKLFYDVVEKDFSIFNTCDTSLIAGNLADERRMQELLAYLLRTGWERR